MQFIKGSEAGSSFLKTLCAEFSCPRSACPKAMAIVCWQNVSYILHPGIVSLRVTGTLVTRYQGTSAEPVCLSNEVSRSLASFLLNKIGYQMIFLISSFKLKIGGG